MARTVQGVKTELIQVSMWRPEQIDDKGCRAVHDMYQDNEDKEVAIQDFDVVRSEIFKISVALDQ